MDNRTELDKQVAAARASSASTRGLGSLDMEDADFGVISVNELGLDQKQSADQPGQPKHDDPVGLGWGAWARPLGRLKYYIGKLRIDALRWKDGRKHRTEVGFLKLAVDELYDNNGRPVPMVAVYLTQNDTGSNDADEQPVAIFTREGIRFLAPVHMEAGSNAPVAGRVTRFYSDGGKFCFNMQDGRNASPPSPENDIGAMVQYLIVPTAKHPHIVTADESTWEPVATWQGKAI